MALRKLLSSVAAKLHSSAEALLLGSATAKLLGSAAAKLLSSAASTLLISAAAKMLEDYAAKLLSSAAAKLGTRRHSLVHEINNYQNITNCRTLFKKAALSFLLTNLSIHGRRTRTNIWTPAAVIYCDRAQESAAIIKYINVCESR